MREMPGSIVNMKSEYGHALLLVLLPFLIVTWIGSVKNEHRRLPSQIDTQYIDKTCIIISFGI